MSQLGNETVLTELEAASLLKMSKRMLANRRRAKKIRCLKDGHFISYKITHIAEYLISVEKGTELESHLSDTSRLLEAVQRHLARSGGGRRHAP
jgi:hypothetical protein